MKINRINTNTFAYKNKQSAYKSECASNSVDNSNINRQVEFMGISFPFFNHTNSVLTKNFKLAKGVLPCNKTTKIFADTRMYNLGDDSYVKIGKVIYRLSELMEEYKDGIYTLGNSFDADIFLHDKTAEDKHVTVVKEKGKYYIQDLGSTDGIYVQPIEITQENPIPTLSNFPDQRNNTNSSKNWLNQFRVSSEYKFRHDIDSYWESISPEDLTKCAWKLHIYADSIQDWKKVTNCVGDCLIQKNAIFKTCRSAASFSALNQSEKQKGKAMTIYPKSEKDAKIIAAEIDYILRNNNLCILNSNIKGDRCLGTSGRIFYRYEYKSGRDRDVIVDLNNYDDDKLYRYALYDANRGDDRYLANDMTHEDDPFYRFDPSKVSMIELLFNKHGILFDKLSYDYPRHIEKDGAWYSVGSDATINICKTKFDINDYLIDKPNGIYHLGRAKDNDVIISNPEVSNYHLSAIKLNDKYYIRDVGSTNGTYVKPLKSPEEFEKETVLGSTVTKNPVRAGKTIKIKPRKFYINVGPNAGIKSGKAYIYLESIFDNYPDGKYNLNKIFPDMFVDLKVIKSTGNYYLATDDKESEYQVLVMNSGLHR